jgi:hypothetical protein
MSAVTVVRRRGFLRFSHTFFALPGRDVAADLQRAIQVASPPRDGGWACTEFHTLHVDLGRSEETLRAELKDGVRAEVRRAQERDGLQTEILHPAGSDAVRRFLEFHAREAAVAAAPPADAHLLEELAADGAAVFSLVRSAAEGPELAWHALIVGSGRARLLFSAIARGLPEPWGPAAIGRANRLLHWKELLHFRDRGIAVYDFGGLALTPQDARLEGIDKFKRGFGGRVVTEFKCRRAATPAGRLLLAVERAVARARGVLRSVPAAGGPGGSR